MCKGSRCWTMSTLFVKLFSVQKRSKHFNSLIFWGSFSSRSRCLCSSAPTKLIPKKCTSFWCPHTWQEISKIHSGKSTTFLKYYQNFDQLKMLHCAHSVEVRRICKASHITIILFLPERVIFYDTQATTWKKVSIYTFYWSLCYFLCSSLHALIMHMCGFITVFYFAPFFRKKTFTLKNVHFVFRASVDSL